MPRKFNPLANVGYDLYNDMSEVGIGEVPFKRQDGSFGGLEPEAGSGDMLKCFHPNTQLLTDSGWKNISLVTLEDKVATMTEDGILEFQNPNHIFEYNYDGILLGRETKQLKYLVTPNHRMYVRKWLAGGNPYRTWSEFVWEEASDVQIKQRSFPITAKWIGQSLPESIFNIDSKIFIKFIAWFLSEGCVSGSKIFITQKNEEYLEEIENILNDVCLALERKLGKNNHNYNFRHSELSDYLKQFGKAKDKFIPSFIKDSTPNDISLFLETYMKGDGAPKDNIIRTTSAILADDIQELALKAGYWSSLRTSIVDGYTKGVKLFILTLNKNNIQGSTSIKHNFEIPYKGKVHCVEVDNGILYTRYDNKPVFLGNSIYDINENGVVDNSEKLDGELPTFYATDSLVVHKADEETITGAKTFETDTLLALDVTSADDFTINVAADKQIVLVKDGGGYDWVHIPVILTEVTGVTAPDSIALPGNVTIYEWGFDGGVKVESLQSKNALGAPHAYVEGADIKLYIVSCGVNSNAGNIKWFVDYSWIDLSDPDREMSATATTSVILANPGLGTNGRCKFTDAAITIPGTGLNIATNMNIRIYRDPTDAEDTYDSDAILQCVNFHVPVNSLGSRQELVR